MIRSALLGLLWTLSTALCVAAEKTQTVDIDGVKYGVAEGLKRSEFNLRVTASGYSLDTKPTVCVLVNYLDKDNHYRAEIGWDGSRLFRVEGGQAMPIGFASAEGLPKEGQGEIVIKRRETVLAAVVNGRIVAQAYDDFFGQGMVGLGTKGGAVALADFTRQPYSRVIFASDFMLHVQEQTKFTPVSGTWEHKSLPNPSLSANAFCYLGQGSPEAPGCSIAGGWSWDDYSYRVAAKHTGGRIGIYFYYRDDKNYYLFRWGARGSKADVKELIKCRDGQQTVVAQAPGGYLINQWYALGVEVQGTHAIALIDGTEVLRHHDRDLAFGKIGLYTENSVGTTFDDVYVLGTKHLNDEFSGEPILWQQLGGEWKAEGEGGPRAFGVSADAAAKAVAGQTRWEDYSLAADITPPRKGSAGLCLHYLDEVNYYGLWLSADGKLKLGRTVEGKQTPLGQASLPPEVLSKPAIRLGFSYSDGIIRATADGQPCMEVWDASLAQGKVGLLAEATRVRFDNVCVDFPPEPEPVLTYNEVFKGERTMKDWADAQSDWLPAKVASPDVTDADATTLWHRGNFFGDVDMEAKLETGESPTWTATMVISADEPRLERGYRLELRKASPAIVRLLRNGKEVAAQKLADDRTVRRMGIRKRGRFVFGSLDDQLAIHFRDEQPLNGFLIAIREEGVKFLREDQDDMKVFCPNVSSFTFARAVDDWRVAAGEWEVANRWQCDPRWSWFCGGSKSGLAAIWHKRHFAGDVTLEFCASIKMDRTRGMEYKFARDMDATICGDGLDLTKGYGFLLGGYNNTVTSIVRNGVTVASNKSFLLPATSSMHRQWWYIKIEKKGSRLRYFVDNRLILEYTDPQPLGGDRVALWTYNDAIMVARVRVAAQDTSRVEPPDFQPPAICRCIYDTP